MFSGVSRGVSGCPETPPPDHDLFNQGVSPLVAQTLTGYLHLRRSETPLQNNSGYATDVGDEYHYLCVCSYFNAERNKLIGNGMIMNPLTYKHLLNSRNSSKQISNYWYNFLKVCMENIDRDVILLRQNV